MSPTDSFTYMSNRIYKLMSLTDNFSTWFFLFLFICWWRELKCFYCIFVYNGVNSPLICDFVKPVLIYLNKVLLLLFIRSEKAKKRISINANHSYHQHSFPYAGLNWSNNKIRFNLNQTNRERWDVKLVDVIKHLPYKVFLSWYHH